jgi:hypothetical protein
MRLAAIIALVCALGLGIFSWWGTRTEAGRRKFDEMAGIIPEFAGVAAVLIGAIGVVLFVLILLRAR